jgi:hypothetical protein
MLRRIGGMPQLGDFQHWPPWRALVAEIARQVLDHVGGTLVIPQTVLVQSYWTEILDILAASDIPVHHFLLHADTPTLRRRIEADTQENKAWRLSHLAGYEAALPWLTQQAQLVDTATLTPQRVAAFIHGRVKAAGGQ